MFWFLSKNGADAHNHLVCCEVGVGREPDLWLIAVVVMSLWNEEIIFWNQLAPLQWPGIYVILLSQFYQTAGHDWIWEEMGSYCAYNYEKLSCVCVYTVSYLLCRHQRHIVSIASTKFVLTAAVCWTPVEVICREFRVHVCAVSRGGTPFDESGPSQYYNALVNQHTTDALLRCCASRP